MDIISASLVDDMITFHENNGEVCPANWKEGEDGMKPDPTGSKEYFGKHN